MKIRACPSPRMLAMGAQCIARRVHQSANDSATMPAFGVQHVMPARAVNVIHIPTAAESARKVRVLKNGTRRVTYR
jgi:hypothetical protein